MKTASGRFAILLITLAGLATGQSQALQDVQSALQRKDYATALRTVRPLAQGGDPNAHFILGTMYAVGLGVSRSNSDAVSWFRKAAEQGHPAAQSNLGVAYLSGQGVQRNYTEAANWLRKAADQNDPQAQANLASVYV